MKSKRFSGLAKICVFTLLITCAAAFASSGLQTENVKTPVLAPGKHFERVMIVVSSFGTRSDHQISFPHDAEHRTVADLLDWKNYAENYPSGVQPYLESSKGKYARKHVPFLSFEKIQKESYGNVVSVDTKDPHNAFVTAVEMFRKDPKKFPLPRYMFYTSNLDDDGHDPSTSPRRDCKRGRPGCKLSSPTRRRS